MLKILAYAAKIGALLIGILEAIAKVIAGIISLKPTKKGDKLLAWIDIAASWIKKGLYTISDKAATD